MDICTYTYIHILCAHAGLFHSEIKFIQNGFVNNKYMYIHIFVVNKTVLYKFNF